MENNATVRLYSLGWREMRTYMFALLFIVGNIALPQLCHLFPQGGLILLPIYFFTLIAAYKFGFRVGLLTARQRYYPHSSTRHYSECPLLPHCPSS